MLRETPPIEAMLQKMAKDGASAVAIADASISLWTETSAALSPIIGQHGVVALYKRTLHLAGRTHPWLIAVQERTATSRSFDPLHGALLQQPPAAAAAAVGALLTTFHELLASLIGTSLTERLLRPIWSTSSNGQTVKDTNSP